MVIPKTAKLLLGALLVAINIVNPFIDTTTGVHMVISLASVSFAAVGIGPEMASSLSANMPLWLAHVLGLVAAIGTSVVVQVDGLSDGVKAVVGALLAFLAAIGITPIGVAGDAQEPPHPEVVQQNTSAVKPSGAGD